MEMCLKLERVKRFPLMNKYLFLNDENVTELGTLFMLLKYVIICLTSHFFV